ncbi:MAG: TadE/TadG family type IV pilus assembly protein [Holosporales bacterium]
MDRWKRLIRSWIDFWGGEAAVTAVEFALVVPLFLSMVLGLIAFALVALVQNALEAGAFEIMRLVTYGHFTPKEALDQVIPLLQSDSFGLISPESIDLVLEEGRLFRPSGGEGMEVRPAVLKVKWALLTDFLGQPEGMSLGAHTLLALKR